MRLDASKMVDDEPNTGLSNAFVDDSGEVYEFRSRKDVEAFAINERAFWGEITEAIAEEPLRQSLIDHLKQGLDILEADNPLGGLLTMFDRSEAAYLKTMAEYGDGRRPTRTSSLATSLKKAQQTDNAAAAATETRCHIGTFLITLNAPEVSSLTIAANDAARDLRNAAEEAKAIQEAAPQIVSNLNEAQSVADTAKTTLNTQLEKSDEWHKDVQKTIQGACKVAAEEAREETTKSVHTALELDVSHAYWSQRRGRHQVSRETSLTAFVTLCVVAMFAIPLYVNELIKGQASGEGVLALDPLVLSFALVAAPGLIAVWLIRMASKTLTVNQNLETDAAERETMIKSFLALNANERLTPEDKHLILRAIFRPAHSNAEEDPLPSWKDALIGGMGQKREG